MRNASMYRWPLHFTKCHTNGKQHCDKLPPLNGFYLLTLTASLSNMSTWRSYVKYTFRTKSNFLTILKKNKQTKKTVNYKITFICNNLVPVTPKPFPLFSSSLVSTRFTYGTAKAPSGDTQGTSLETPRTPLLLFMFWKCTSAARSAQWSHTIPKLYRPRSWAHAGFLLRPSVQFLDVWRTLWLKIALVVNENHLPKTGATLCRLGDQRKPQV